MRSLMPLGFVVVAGVSCFCMTHPGLTLHSRWLSMSELPEEKRLFTTQRTDQSLGTKKVA
jgi:hypothetical protein